MKRYNLYYLRDGLPYDVQGLELSSVLNLTWILLRQGCEITGIIDAEQD